MKFFKSVALRISQSLYRQLSVAFPWAPSAGDTLPSSPPKLLSAAGQLCCSRWPLLPSVSADCMSPAPPAATAWPVLYQNRWESSAHAGDVVRTLHVGMVNQDLRFAMVDFCLFVCLFSCTEQANGREQSNVMGNWIF